MKVLVCGGRDFSDKAFLYEKLDGVHARKPITLLIHGAAKGADSLAAEWAADRGVHAPAVAALWNVYGKAAGPKRNEAMLLLEPEWVIAFPGGRGTAHMVAAARKAGVRIVWEPKP